MKKKFIFLFLIALVATMFIGCAQPTDDLVIPEVSDVQSSWEDNFKEDQAEFDYTNYFSVVESDRWHKIDNKNPNRYLIRLNADYSIITNSDSFKFDVSATRISAYNAYLKKDDVKNILEMLIKQNMLTPKAK